MGQQKLNLRPLILMSAAEGQRLLTRNGQTSVQAPLGTDGCPNRTKLVPSSSRTETWLGPKRATADSQMAIAVTAASLPLGPRGSTTLLSPRILPGSVSVTDLIWPTQGAFALAVVKSAVLSGSLVALGMDSGATAVWLAAACAGVAVVGAVWGADDEHPVSSRAAIAVARAGIVLFTVVQFPKAREGGAPPARCDCGNRWITGYRRTHSPHPNEE